MISIEQLKTDAAQRDSQTQAEPLTRESASRLLGWIIDNSSKHRLAFDLDSTLLDNKQRNAVIMREFAATHDEPQLAGANVSHFSDWSASNAMRRIGLEESRIDSLVTAYSSFWSKRFFTSDYCQYDCGVPGAADFVQAVRQAGGSVCYLTGRHEGMRKGTVASLQKNGFPVPGNNGVELLMKPGSELSDDTFKVETLEKLKSELPILAAFDNEPMHINSYRSVFPDAVCVHLFTDHSMRDVKLLDEIYSIYDFIR